MLKIPVPTDKDLIDKFWDSVDKSGDCWLWTALLQPAGYGQIHVDGKRLLAHRFSWVLANGEIPAGMFVLHKCDNPPCVNPDHLFLGTQTENMADMKSKLRGTNGERSTHSVLCAGDVGRIRDMLRCGALQREVANWFGVDRTTIGKIKRGVTWHHLEE